MFYLTTHSTHFIYGYMVSDIWYRTTEIPREETRCRHYMGFLLKGLHLVVAGFFSISVVILCHIILIKMCFEGVVIYFYLLYPLHMPVTEFLSHIPREQDVARW